MSAPAKPSARCTGAFMPRCGPAGCSSASTASRRRDVSVKRAQFDEWLAHLRRAYTPSRSRAIFKSWSLEDVYVPLDAEIAPAAVCRLSRRAVVAPRRVLRHPGAPARFRLKLLDDARARELVRPGGGRLPSTLGGAVAARSARAVPQAHRPIVRGDRGRRPHRLYPDRPHRRLRVRPDAQGAAARARAWFTRLRARPSRCTSTSR